MWHVQFKVLTPDPEPTVILLGKQTVRSWLVSLAHIVKRVLLWWDLSKRDHHSEADLRLTIQLRLRKVGWQKGSSPEGPAPR